MFVRVNFIETKKKNKFINSKNSKKQYSSIFSKIKLLKIFILKYLKFKNVQKWEQKIIKNIEKRIFKKV